MVSESWIDMRDKGRDTNLMISLHEWIEERDILIEKVGGIKVEQRP